jgi:hypothetical protein
LVFAYDQKQPLHALSRKFDVDPLSLNNNELNNESAKKINVTFKNCNITRKEVGLTQHG